MRSINTILKNALANQQGELILRVLTWTNITAYNAAPSVPDHTWQVKKFSISSTSATAELVTENDYLASNFSVFIIERGAKISGTEYPIQSGLYFIKSYNEDYGTITITGSSFPNIKINIAAGSGTYQAVIQAFCTAIGKTAVFKKASDPWLTYQFLQTGKPLTLNKAELFENLLKQKFCILVYETSPKNLVFYNQDSYATGSTKAINDNSGTLVTVATSGEIKAQTSTNSTDWVTQTITNFHNSIAYSPTLGLYVAVGISVAASSPDGVTWTVRTIPAGTYTSVHWSQTIGIFVAVGTNLCATSTNGTTWTVRTIGTGTWESVTSNASLLVATSSEATGKINTSTNGITWSARAPWTQYEANTSAQQTIWVSELSLFITCYYTLVYRSSDGITWAYSTTYAANWMSVAWSPTLRLLVMVSNSDATYAVQTSPDGITWTQRVGLPANTWRSVCWSPALGIFCAVGHGATNRIMTSPDGINWTSRTPAQANNLNYVIWSPELNLFAVTSQDGVNRVQTSPDGINWTVRVAPAKLWNSLSYSPSLHMFCATADDTLTTSNVMTSVDGITWTQQTSASAGAFRRSAWSASLGMFVTVSYSNYISMYSTNGSTWTTVAFSSVAQWGAVCWSDTLGIFLASSTAVSQVAIWDGIVPTFPNLIKHADYSASKYVAVGISKCFTSTNGVMWTSQTIPAGTYNSVAYSSTLALWVAVGASVCASSPDGITWTARTITAQTWQDVVWSATLSLFVAVSSDGGNKVITSTNGLTWILQSTTTDFSLSYLDGKSSHLDRAQSSVCFVWRDEGLAYHTLYDTTLPQWNLGFIKSTETAPITNIDPTYKVFLQKSPVRLDITDGDKIKFTPYWSIDPTKTIDSMMIVNEFLDVSRSPAWYQEITSISLFAHTEGGALPISVEKISAYAPFTSSGFNGTLSSGVSNFQTLAEAVDNFSILTPAQLSGLTGGGLTVLHSHSASSSKIAYRLVTNITSGAINVEAILFSTLLPANTITVGKSYRVTMVGHCVQGASFLFRSRIGINNTIADTLAWYTLATTAQVLNNRSSSTLTLTCRTIGATGTIILDGVSSASALVLPTAPLLGASVPIVVNTTVINYLSFSVLCTAGTFTANTGTIIED